MAQITYANKVKIDDNPNLPAENKVRDVDMNEIKEVVNTNDTNFSQFQAEIAGTTIPITWDSTITEITGVENSIKVNAAEKSCLLTFGVTKDSSVASSHQIGSFNSDYAPNNLVIGTAVTSVSGVGTFGCQISIGTDGSITINNTGHNSDTFRGQIKWYYS